MRHHGARHGRALALAAGQFARLVGDAPAEPDSFQNLAGAVECLRRRHAPDEQRHRDVFENGEFHQQVVELIDESERAVSQFPGRFRGEVVDVAAFHQHLAAAWVVEAAEDVQQRGFSGTGRADYRDALAFFNRQADFGERIDC